MILYLFVHTLLNPHSTVGDIAVQGVLTAGVTGSAATSVVATRSYQAGIIDKALKWGRISYLLSGLTVTFQGAYHLYSDMSNKDPVSTGELVSSGAEITGGGLILGAVCLTGWGALALGIGGLVVALGAEQSRAGYSEDRIVSEILTVLQNNERYWKQPDVDQKLPEDCDEKCLDEYSVGFDENEIAFQRVSQELHYWSSQIIGLKRRRRLVQLCRR